MKLYTYDHCPYCVRVRYALGLLNIDFEHEILLNDDEETPIGLIGSKMVPILIKDDGEAMGESMDIVAYADGLEGDRVFVDPPEVEHGVLMEWIAAQSMSYRELLFPRWVEAPLPEFATESAQAYFTRKKTDTIGDFELALDRTSQLKAAYEESLNQLSLIIQSADGVHGAISADDVDLFGRLRGITLIKDLLIPANVRSYIDRQAERGKVDLYDDRAVK